MYIFLFERLISLFSHWHCVSSFWSNFSEIPVRNLEEFRSHLKSSTAWVEKHNMNIKKRRKMVIFCTVCFFKSSGWNFVNESGILQDFRPNQNSVGKIAESNYSRVRNRHRARKIGQKEYVNIGHGKFANDWVKVKLRNICSP